MTLKNIFTKFNAPFKGFIIILLLFIFITQAKSQIHWESMILETDTWKYLAATSEPPSDWYQSAFVDAAWNTGKGGLGYGDNDDATVVSSCGSLYLRLQTYVPNAALVKELLLDIDYDDAFILYINGVEQVRSSNVNGNFPSFNTTLSTDHEAKMYSGGNPERYTLNASSLVSGVNTFSIQILNQGVASSDLSARVFVHARINSPNILYHSVPTWFTPPVNNNSSNLPLIFIETNGQTIIQNTKIMADMKTLNSAYGINYLTDTTFEYKGKVGIEIRGFTSSGFPKKSYTVETRNADTSNLNVSLLGLPKENDWVFHGPYPDKSLMRNYLAYNLGNKTGKWSPRTKFFELYIDGAYNGVYTLVEKIKIDKNRLNLAGINPIDTVGDKLTGGYVLKLDRPETTDVDGIDYWISPYRAPTTLQQKEYFLFVDPKGDELVPKQRDYIKNYITTFENTLYSNNYKDPATGYYQYIDFPSFVDYYIITELSRNLDGYRISTFLHKDKDSKGGKLTMGPFWDYDICFGNANFFSAGNTAGWIIEGMGNGDAYAMPFWWQKFRLDPYFNTVLKQRWNIHKTNFINTTYINNVIDSAATVMAEAQVRNFTKWNILNTWTWPNNYVGGTYTNELTYLKNWIRDRITWMDSQIQAIVEVTGTNDVKENRMQMITYPNPFVESVHFKYLMEENGNVEIYMINSTGQKVYQNVEYVYSGIYTKKIEFDLPLAQGIYVYKILIDGKLRSTGKLIKQ